MKTNKILVYGAAGYTGKIISNRIKELGLSFSIAGRNDLSISSLAKELDVTFHILNTNENALWKVVLSDVTCVINAAGPFDLTANDIMKACLENKVHYLDISAELATYQLAETYDQRAKESNIMIMSGAGLFVSYDALVVHTVKRVKNPVQLNVAFRHFGGFSKGSIASSKHIVDLGLLIRQDDKLIKTEDASSKMFDFGEGAEECFPTPLGGIIISHKSTGIKNIREYFQLKVSALSDKVSTSDDGPSAKERASGRNKLAVEVFGESGERAYSLADLPSGYDLTPLSIVAIADRVLKGDFKIGNQTPGTAYGESIINDIPGAKVSDL